MRESDRDERAPILVVGGGIAGMTCALEAAEAGAKVILIEKSASLGGRVAGFHRYFPKLCPPPCGLEIDFRRLRTNPNITVTTLTELERLQGEPGDYQAALRSAPRFVTAECTACGACTNVCPAETPDSFNYELSKTKAIHRPHLASYPERFVIAREACPVECQACVEACPCGAVDLAQKESRTTVRVSSVVLATGWEPYDATRLDNLGYGQYPNVITNVVLERLAAADGPTAGKIARPSDGKAPRAVAFVQCAGSRDENHLPYCSGVCCTASLKQAGYIRAQYPEAKITMFYIDLRTPGQLDSFAAKAVAEHGIELIKGKVGKVQEHPATRDLLVSAEDILRQRKITREYDMVVLAVGMVPQSRTLPVEVVKDAYGFAANGANGDHGIFAAGCLKRPSDVAATVRDATGTALCAMQPTLVGASHE
ncbi:MAG: FAD-dependent oxidoreductase [Acidobacteriota bacterium]